MPAESYGELVDRWLGIKRAEGLSPSTVARYVSAARPLREVFGKQKVEAVTPERLDALYAELGKTMGGASIRKVHRVANGVGQLALRYGLARSIRPLGRRLQGSCGP